MPRVNSAKKSKAGKSTLDNDLESCPNCGLHFTDWVKHDCPARRIENDRAELSRLRQVEAKARELASELLQLLEADKWLG